MSRASSTASSLPPPPPSTALNMSGSMRSPLAISNIVLSQSEGGSSRASPTHGHGHHHHKRRGPAMSADYYRHALSPSNPVPVLVRLRRARILLATLGLAAGLSVLTYIGTRGLVVGRVHSSSNNGPRFPAASSQIDAYNARLALVTALVGRPLELLVAMVLPVWLWCFFTATILPAATTTPTSSTTTTLRRVRWLRIGVLAATVGLVYLLGNAFYAAHVLLVPVRLGSWPSEAAAVAASLPPSMAPAPLEDTLLRSIITGDARPRRSQCTRPSPRPLARPSIEFGFRARPWMAGLSLSLANATSASMSLSTTTSVVDATAPPVLPMSIEAATALATYLVPVLETLLTPSSSSASSSASDRAAINNATTPAALVSALNATLHRLRGASSSARIQWLDFTEALIAWDRLALDEDEGLAVETLRLDVPLRRDYLQRRLVLSPENVTTSVSYDHRGADGAYYFDVNPHEECGEGACLVSPRADPTTDALIDDGVQVRALPICVKARAPEAKDQGDDVEDVATTAALDGRRCPRHSTTSFLVLSVASRIVGDAWAGGTNTSVLRLKNARKFYSVTVGRLSWAEAMRACAQDTGATGPCEHLRLTIAPNWTLSLPVSELPLEELRASTASPSTWPVLARANAREVDSGGSLKSDLLLPRNFNTTTATAVNASSTMTVVSPPSVCEADRGHLLATITANHWFAERSYEPAVASGALWLLQGAEIDRTAPSSTGTSGTHGQWRSGGPAARAFDIVVRVPMASAILTYTGCAILGLMSVSVFLFGKQKESHIERFFTPHHLAQTVVGASSALFPSPALLQSDLLHIGGDLLSSSDAVGEFEIVSLTLRHRRAPGTIVQVPRQPSITSSSSV